jgi:hypothetical protein
MTLPGMPAPPTPASPTPTPAQQKITTDPTKQAEAFGVKPAQGGVGATEEGAKLATEFSGEKQKMAGNQMAGDQS